LIDYGEREREREREKSSNGIKHRVIIDENKSIFTHSSDRNITKE